MTYTIKIINIKTNTKEGTSSYSLKMQKLTKNCRWNIREVSKIKQKYYSDIRQYMRSSYINLKLSTCSIFSSIFIAANRSIFIPTSLLVCRAQPLAAF